jgi:2-oxoglutarate dehydrogenase E1 component
VSNLKDLSQGGFQEVLDDAAVQATTVKRVVFCTGKLYYELLDMQQKHNRTDVAIVRLEQLYPFPLTQIQAIISKYKKAQDYFWVQEEPENMGAWNFVDRRIESVLKTLDIKAKRPDYVGREEAASPATGLAKVHQQQQEALVRAALAG